jgi:multidrug resistance efflux pump
MITVHGYDVVEVDGVMGLDIVTTALNHRDRLIELRAAIVAHYEAANDAREARIAEARAEITAQFADQLASAQARIAELEAGGDPGPDINESGVPAWVDMGRFREALIDWGIIPDQITAMLQQIPDETERIKALNRWEFFTNVRRDSPLVEQVRVALGRTVEDTDQLFIDALAIV